MDVRVIPGSSADRVLGCREGALRVGVHAPPEKGKANRALLRYLAKALGVRKSAVSLAAGERDRHKIVLVEGMHASELERAVRALLEEK
jgi:uncharacterized protein (TIGR00251 family)